MFACEPLFFHFSKKLRCYLTLLHQKLSCLVLEFFLISYKRQLSHLRSFSSYHVLSLLLVRSIGDFRLLVLLSQPFDLSALSVGFCCFDSLAEIVVI